MEEIKLFAVVLVVHYIADFILQTDSQAKGKSKGSDVWNLELFKHVLTYTGIWGLVYFLLPIQEPFNQPIGWIFFVILIGVPHYITDWITIVTKRKPTSFNRWMNLINLKINIFV